MPRRFHLRDQAAQNAPLGDRIRVAGTVYGTIIIMSVLAAGARPYQHHLWRLIVIAGVSVVVLWLAHVYAHGLGESLRLGRRLTIAELLAIARREYSIVAAAVLPLLSVGLGASGVLAAGPSVRLALWIGVVALAAQGLRYAQIEHLGSVGTLASVGLNVTVGLALVALEVLIAH